VCNKNKKQKRKKERKKERKNKNKLINNAVSVYINMTRTDNTLSRGDILRPECAADFM